MGTTTFSGPVKSGDILATGGATLGTNIANTKNHFIAGPITVTSPAIWTVTGSGTLTII